MHMAFLGMLTIAVTRSGRFEARFGKLVALVLAPAGSLGRYPPNFGNQSPRGDCTALVAPRLRAPRELHLCGLHRKCYAS